MAEARYRTRRRADGWVVWDGESRMVVGRFCTNEAAANRQAAKFESAPDERTYSVVWYCEVDASTPEQAVARARKFLAPTYRDGWEPLSVELVEP